MATSDTAEALGVDDDVGSISPGKVADLAAFDGDPAATSAIWTGHRRSSKAAT